jgi:hypothetical protein
MGEIFHLPDGRRPGFGLANHMICIVGVGISQEADHIMNGL